MKDVLISVGIGFGLGFGLVAGAALGIFGATLLMCGMFCSAVLPANAKD